MKDKHEKNLCQPKQVRFNKFFKKDLKYVSKKFVKDLCSDERELMLPMQNKHTPKLYPVCSLSLDKIVPHRRYTFSSRYWNINVKYSSLAHSKKKKKTTSHKVLSLSNIAKNYYIFEDNFSDSKS